MYLSTETGMLDRKLAETIESYTDADWVGDRSTRRSTSGYFTLVEGTREVRNKMLLLGQVEKRNSKV